MKNGRQFVKFIMLRSCTRVTSGWDLTMPINISQVEVSSNNNIWMVRDFSKHFTDGIAKAIKYLTRRTGWSVKRR